jgi:uncharacterized protein YndB with AHSA1/START domain
MIPSIQRKITVNATVEHTFKVFTESFTTWWPPEYHIGQAEYAEAVLEPHVGGRWYEKGVDGSECDWGKVLAWEPPHRVLVTWQINGHWAYDPDPSHASELEIRFDADGPQQTVVALEHRHIDRLVDSQAAYDAISAEGGWTMMLERFAKAVDQG